MNHDPSQRPTAEELLASDLVPPVQLEASELHEMLKNALANPQSKAYKHIVSRCLQQESDEILEHTYHIGGSRTMKLWTSPLIMDSMITLSPVTEYVKAKIVSIFRKHGGIEVDTPLLSPYTTSRYGGGGGGSLNWWHPVRLMTHSGSVVVLPSDLRREFARHVAINGVNMIRRYCIGRIYREEKVFNFHPKQNYQCAFDIITPYSANHLVDAELLAIAYEIISSMPKLLIRNKNFLIRINHTNLLRAILIYCNVPKDMYEDLFDSILDFIEGRVTKFQFHASVNVIMEKTRTSATTLIDLLLASFLITGKNCNDDASLSSLKTLVRGKGEASSLAKSALREMETIVSLAQSMGVKCPIHVFAGLPISYDRCSGGGIVWQLTANIKVNQTNRPSVLAVGERYDSMLLEFQKQAQNFNLTNTGSTNRSISGAGFSISLDKLVTAITSFSGDDSQYLNPPTIEVGICVSGSRPPLKDVTYIMRLLWSMGIRCGFLEALSDSIEDTIQDLANLGATHIILVSENGALRIRSWEREHFQERHVTRSELVDFIDKLSRTEFHLQHSFSFPIDYYGSGHCNGNYHNSNHYHSISSSICGIQGGGSANSGGNGSGASGANTLSGTNHLQHSFVGYGCGSNSGRGSDPNPNFSLSNTNIKNLHNSSLNDLPNIQVNFLIHEKLTANYRRRYENQVNMLIKSI